MKALAYLNKYFLKYKWRFLLGIVFIILSNIFAVYAPQIVRFAFNSIEELAVKFQESGDAELKSRITEAALYYSGMYLLLFLLKGFFLFLTRQTIIVMSRFIEFDLKNEVYAHYQDLNMGFYKRNNTGDLMNRITEDVSRVRMYLGPAIMYTINLAVLFVMVISVMLSVNVELTLYVLTPLPILSITIYYISSVINRKSERVQRQLSTLSTFVQEAFSGIRVLKAYNREKSFEDQFDTQAGKYRDLSLSLARTNAFFYPAVMLLIGLSTILTIFIGGTKVINGSIQIGHIAEFVIYVNMLTWPFASVGWVTSLVQRAAASQERINEFLKTKPEIHDPSNEEETIKGDLEFNKVSFTYPDSGIQALKHLSFKITAGQTLAVIGRTGSGKSTLANLMIRQYDPTEGQILVDGKDLSTMNLSSLRSKIGYAPQEVFLFSDTIKNNIAFGVDEADHSAIEKAASDADVLDNIKHFQNGFETMLGERGITLSGGQKQRVSIARAIIRSPKILIFDDCLSAVDTQTEENILQNLKKIMKDRTSVIISHRVSSVKNADHIIVLEEGRKVEEGNHDFLLEKQGVYAEMHRQQLLKDKGLVEDK